jgi:hypothetical protein
MFNLEMILLIVIAITVPYLFYLKISNQDLKKKLKKAEKTIIQKESNVDFKYAQSAIEFLDKIIKDKFNYHLYTNILPAYMDNKIPEKKVISDIKDKIYVSVVGGLSQETKKSILNFFTEKGIEIYVHEKIMTHMNETDFRTVNKHDEAFKNLDARRVNTVMP